MKLSPEEVEVLLYAIDCLPGDWRVAHIDAVRSIRKKLGRPLPLPGADVVWAETLGRYVTVPHNEETE